MRFKREEFKIFILAIAIFLVLPNISAAHYIVGFVNDSLDGIDANGYEVVLWNPANGINDNLTDIIGPTGNSGTDNFYFLDCEMLSTSCIVGDEIRAKVLNNGSDYITGETNLIVTGAGFDAMPDTKLNSKPTMTLGSPINSFNFSSSEINLSCTANDLDSNLANVTLYGNWGYGWHANETKTAVGTSNEINFTKNLLEGNYEWSCLATDNLSISGFSSVNYTFTIDLTPPVISDVSSNLSGTICGLTNYARVNCTVTDALTSVNSILIEATSPQGNKTNYTASLLSGDTYFSDILLDEIGNWNFNCFANDSAGNLANKTSEESPDIKSASADLIISSNDILFSNLDPIENELVTINATILNLGCSDADNFLVGFYDDNPDTIGTQIGDNQTTSITGLSNGTVNISWFAKIGINNIFVSLDLDDIISEYNESNNKANNTIEVGAWQEFYGNVSVNKLLGNQNVKNLSLWFNETTVTGNVFITDSESDVDWTLLKAIGKNSTVDNTANDFSEIDSIFNNKHILKYLISSFLSKEKVSRLIKTMSQKRTVK